MPDIILQNDVCRLVIGEDALPKSLKLLSSDEELLQLDTDRDYPLFASTQARPFNNEIKLAHPNKRTTFNANHITKDGDKLIVSFELVPYQAVIRVNIQPLYIAFTLEEFLFSWDNYDGISMDLPPVIDFRLLQLPIKDRGHFGEWLNVNWDEKAAVNVLSTSPYAIIDAEKYRSYHIMTADALKEVRMEGTGAALIAIEQPRLLDAIDQLEHDFDLPLGVESRRRVNTINSSLYWSCTVNPTNVDEQIALAKKGGFRMMLIAHHAIVKELWCYEYCGNFEYRDEYPNGRADLIEMLNKIKAAGIIPGFHFLQTHIGLHSQYVMAPRADHRTRLLRHFTLARPHGEHDTEIYVEENPLGAVQHPRCRYLRFGGEVISYEGFTTERPYHFYGCIRGRNKTSRVCHPIGEIGGIMDISEFAAASCYVDQNASLADEIADKIADIYNAGFQFAYLDGSEGTNPPYEYHVPAGQYRVIKRMDPQPLFTEGAAKAHFSWHFLAGGNAFDCFPPEKFKRALDKHPAEEAPRMRDDFTSVNFGWWYLDLPNTQPDHFEYGTSHAAGFECPITLQTELSKFYSHPRLDDLFEVMKRWEDVRQRNWLSDRQKAMLQVPGDEYTLIYGKDGDYELIPYEQIETPEHLRAFAFTYEGDNFIVYWCPDGNGTAKVALDASAITLWTEPNGDKVGFDTADGGAVLPNVGKRYLRSTLPMAQLKEAFKAAAVDGEYYQKPQE